ncbi:MbnP family copper-binding protein [Devosia sediminis]|uniref:Metallo-mystery pair system four-Cys motif protein n=1 Tax=Devosia sediminis TaxID=2798801 RepID=A0A934IT58_9HYPH|nr:MbnP family copper-binding protein [Devosia sediminis]MBJ3784701.1 metallo-mystery pair system four-Cys motif protein [Devosia sediminis]
MKHVLAGALALIAAAFLPVASWAEAPATPVSIFFAGEVNGSPFACGQTYDDLGQPPSSITPSDFRFYIMDVALIDAGGEAVPVTIAERSPWQADGITLIDFEDGTGPCDGGNPGLNDRIEGHVPEGHYQGLRFTMGLPFLEAHGDVTIASAPLDLSAMFWSWQSGYRYLKVDMVGDMTGGHGGRPTGFSVHLGDSGCVGPTFSQRPVGCAHINVVSGEFADFDPSNNRIVADLGRLLAETDVAANTPDTAPGCMSEMHDPDCIGVFARLGLGFVGTAPGLQTFFESR